VSPPIVALTVPGTDELHAGILELVTGRIDTKSHDRTRSHEIVVGLLGSEDLDLVPSGRLERRKSMLLGDLIDAHLVVHNCTISSNRFVRVPGQVMFEGSQPAVLEPVRAFEAAHRAIAALPSPLLVIDDLQWVDELSVALCHYLARAAEASGTSLLVLAPGRPGESTDKLAVALGGVLPPTRYLRRELGPLTLEDGIRLSRCALSAPRSGKSHKAVGKSEGSPFWIEALLNSGGAEANAGKLVTGRFSGVGSDVAEL
jgi:hypothetical protein